MNISRIADALGHPIVIGASRKRFLGSVVDRDHAPHAAADRDHATTALHALLARASHVDVVRTHNVAATRDAIKIAEKWASYTAAAQRRVLRHA